MRRSAARLARGAGTNGIEQALRERVSGDVSIVADGYACRDQIGQPTGRRALHPAQVLDPAQPAHGEMQPAAQATR